MLDQARQYLAKVIAWPEDGSAYINVHWTFVPDNLAPGRKPPWSGAACKNLNEAVRAVERALTRNNTRDIYVCLSTQRNAEEAVSKNGFKFYRPIRNQENAVAIKSLFFDIDLKGGDKGYDDMPSAITALGNFIKKVGLPRPSLAVASGGGLHVYWTLMEALTPEAWKPLAFALANAAKTLGLKCDLNVTVDCARVLRIPDTFNRKLDQPRPVAIAGKPADFDYSVERIEKALEPYKIAVPQAAGLDRKVFPYKPPLPDNPLGAGIETAMPVAELQACLDAIPNDASVDYGAWVSVGMRVYAASEGADYGLQAWQAWSAKHPNAAADEAQKCAERWETFQPTRTGAGALINQVRALTGDATWSPRVNTPVTIQQVVAPQPVNDLPAGYTRDHDGIVQRLAKLEDGSTMEIPLCDYAMEKPWLQESPHVLHFLTKIQNRDRPIDIPTEIVSTMEMRRYLQQQGFMVPVGAKATEHLGAFMSSWITKLQQTTTAVKSEPFGWHVKNSKPEGFIYGGQMWTPNGDSPAAAADPVLARHYSPAGDIQPWKDAAKLITDQHRPELEALLASSFAAPLVRFTGQFGVLLSAYSQASGIGKSTTMKIAQAVWGDPIKAVQSLSDTQNSIMHKLGQIRSLPLYWDELKTEEDTRKFVNVTFQTTQGKERSRMSRNISQREPGSWQTLLVSASNDSLLDYVLGQTNMTTAGLYRVFEYHMDPPAPGAPGQIGTSAASLMVAKLHDHYGSVGLEYAKFLGRNLVQVENDVAVTLESIEKEAKAGADERFWMALITVLLVGAKYAKQQGFVQFDVMALKAFLFDVLAKMRQVKIDQPVDMSISLNVSHLLQQFLGAMRARHTLYTDKIHVSKGKPAKGAYTVKCDTSRLEGIYVHVGLDDKLMRISSAAIGDWLSDKGYSRHMFITALEKELGFKKVIGRIGSGTGDPKLTGAQEYLLQVDYAHPKISKFFDDI